MRRPITLLALATSLLLVATAVPAAAKKPDKPGPQTPTDCETVMSRSANGLVDFGCDWTPDPTEPLAEEGTVTVKVGSGELSGLSIFVRDSSPGDICVLQDFGNVGAGNEVGATFPLVDGEDSYWSSPIHWCERFDPVVGQRGDLNGEALHVRVVARAKRGTKFTISLSPGQIGSN